MGDSIRNQKLARNEYLRKQVNVRIEQLEQRLASASLAPEDAETEFLCACGNPDCGEHVKLAVAEYERVRRQRDRFVVVPGHEHPELERVVERHAEYLVVEKRPEYRRTI